MSETPARELRHEKRTRKRLFHQTMEEQNCQELQEAMTTINDLRHQFEEMKRDLEAVKMERDELLIQNRKLEKENAVLHENIKASE